MKYSFISVKKGRKKHLISQCKVAKYCEDVSAVFPAKEWTALWDTGATGSVISPNIVAVLGLSPAAHILSKTIHGLKWSPQYYVNVLLPSGMVAKKVLVIEGDPIGCDVLIGMDILSEGDFIYSYNNDTTQFGFRAPSELTEAKMKEILIDERVV